MIRKGPETSASEDGDLRVRLDGFVREALELESERQGVGVEELVTFAILYYLADVDSGRISRQVPRGRQTEG